MILSISPQHRLTPMPEEEEEEHVCIVQQSKLFDRLKGTLQLNMHFLCIL